MPQPANPDFSGLQVALRLSIPVFVANAGTTGPAIDWSAATSGDGLILTAKNSGDVHARIHGFSVAPAAGDDKPLAQPVAVIHTSGPGTQLEPRQEPGGARHRPADWRRLRLKVTTDDGESEIDLDATGE